MQKLTKAELAMVSDALDILDPDSEEGHDALDKLKQKIIGMDLLLYPEKAAHELTAAQERTMRELVGTNDELEVDDDLLLSVGDEGVWVNSWCWIAKDVIPKNIQKKLWG